jgi:hypothetical protein
MENEYIEKKIKDQLVNKDFELWDKESIDFLISIFEHEKYNTFYDINLLLFDDYIKWYTNKINENESLENKVINNYPLENLKYVYHLINIDIYNNIHYNYVKILNNINNTNNNDINIYDTFNLNNLFTYIISMLTDTNFCGISFTLIITILYVIFNYIISLFKFEKKIEEKNVFEIKIPIPANLINNPLVKFFLNIQENENDSSFFSRTNLQKNDINPFLHLFKNNFI